MPPFACVNALHACMDFVTLIDNTNGFLWWCLFRMFTYQLQLYFVLILFLVQLMYWEQPWLCTWRMQVCPCPLMKKYLSAVSVPLKRKFLCSGRELSVTPTTSVSFALSMRRDWAIRHVTRLSSPFQNFLMERKVSDMWKEDLVVQETQQQPWALSSHGHSPSYALYVNYLMDPRELGHLWSVS